MARLYLRNVDKKAGPGEWELVLGRGRALLCDPGGIIEADFEVEIAHKRIRLPNFWGSVTNLGITSDAKKVHWFKPNKEHVAEIRRYLAYAPVAQGEGAISKARWQGWGLVFVGSIMLLVSIVAMIFVVIHDTNNPRPGAPRFYAPIGAIVFGGAMLGGGITMLRRAQQAEAEWVTDEAEEQPNTQ